MAATRPKLVQSGRSRPITSQSQPPPDLIVVDYNPALHTATLPHSTESVKIRAEVYRHHYRFPKGHRTVGVVAMTRLLKMNLTKSELRVTLWLPIIAKEHNLVCVSGALAEAELGLERHTFSQVLGRLRKLGLVRKEGCGLFRFNPHYAWNGSAEAHIRACDDWDVVEGGGGSRG